MKKENQIIKISNSSGVSIGSISFNSGENEQQNLSKEVSNLKKFNKDHFKNLIIKNEFSQVFDELMSLNLKNNFENEIILLKSRFEAYKKAKRQGTSKDLEIEINSLIAAILEILDLIYESS